MKEKIENIIKSSIETKQKLLKSEIPNIEKAAGAVRECIGRGGKLLIFGNGGSAADSQHMAAEFVGRFKKERRPMPALALTANTSILTALSNDYGYEVTFKRQIESFGENGDVAIAISTSGNARNVIEAVKTAKQKGLFVIGLSGKGGGHLAPICDIAIIVDSGETARIQEAHILVCHIIAEIAEQALGK